MASICSAVYCNREQMCFPLPKPCSADTVPPNSAACRANCVMAAFARSASSPEFGKDVHVNVRIADMPEDHVLARKLPLERSR